MDDVTSSLRDFINELEELEQKAELRGGDLTQLPTDRESNKATAAAYAFCRIRLRTILSQETPEITKED